MTVLAAATLTVTGVFAMSGQRRLKQSRSFSVLDVDHAWFRSADDSTKIRLEIYYQIHQAGLKFKPDNGRYEADYELKASVFDKKNKVVARETFPRTLSVSAERQTRSRQDFRTSQIDFTLPPARYWVEVELTDINAGKEVNRSFEANLKPLKRNRANLSGLEFVHAVQSAKSAPSAFKKGGYDVVPSVVRTYGGSDSSSLMYYQEVYQGNDAAEQVLLETRLRHWTKGMVYRDTLYVHFDSPVKRQLRRISLAELPAGSYQIEVYLRGRRNKELQVMREQFLVLWSPDQLVRHDWETAIAQLRYIADPSDIKPIKEATTYEERKLAFDAFWDARDPTIGTPENEAKWEFYRRIEYAETHFSQLKREGWRTDRGRIYIEYGPPDELEDVPYAPNALPYQVWHYFTRGEYLRFLFIDENQDGDYRLQFPYDGRGQRPDF